MGERRRWRRIAARGLGLALLGLLAFAGVGVAQAWVPMGKAAEGERRERMEGSPQWAGEAFANPQGNAVDGRKMLRETLAGPSPDAVPHAPLPVEAVEAERFAAPPWTGLRATWLGHSTILIEIDGKRVLTDPLWGPRTGPLSWMGPERWYAPPLPLDELPPLDAVLISHDHYDHLDYPTIVALADRVPLFVVPLGVGAHLEYWGVSPDRIVELDWWERTRLDELELVSVPARHASGRHLFDRDATLWAGYALLSKQHRVYFSGDTGMFDGLADIGERLGPFDLTLIETGAYAQAWPDWHIGPEQAVRAHQIVGGEVMIPIHWGLVNLALHGWTEPVERSVAAAEAAGVVLATPRPGQSIEPGDLQGLERWWPELPWRTAQEYPLVSGQVSI